MTLQDLQDKQSWTLDQKIYHSLEVIGTFVERMGGLDKVYISFSGGKDSTVLLDLARRVYPDITVVFINTGNEWPEILQFVRKIEKSGVNITRLRPEMPPRQVWAKFGFPLVSKEAAERIHRIRFNPDSATAKKWMDEKNPFRLGKRWHYLLSEPYDTDSKCCEYLKKRPAIKYEKETGRYPIIGIMASESKMRETKYLSMGGCNVFNEGSTIRPLSWPLAIWTDEDIWEYIHRRNLEIADIYNKGITRTGCVGCGFGAYRKDKDNPSMPLLYQLHPKYYEMIMNYTNNGVTYREALRKLKQVTNNKLPDEQ